MLELTPYVSKSGHIVRIHLKNREPSDPLAVTLGISDHRTVQAGPEKSRKVQKQINFKITKIRLCCPRIANVAIQRVFKQIVIPYKILPKSFYQ